MFEIEVSHQNFPKGFVDSGSLHIDERKHPDQVFLGKAGLISKKEIVA